MRNIYIWLIGILSFTMIEAFAQKKWTPETLPMVHLQDSTRYVCNPDGVMSSPTTHKVDSILLKLEQDKGVETVVVVVKSIEGDDPYQFGMELGRKYGVGDKKQNSGLIVILCTEDRSYQILTGRGLEGTLPDAICRRVENRVMIPLLKEQQWDAAILETMKALEGIIRQDPSLMREWEDQEADPIILIIFIVIIGAAIFSLYKMAAVANTRICPRCQQKTLKKSGGTTLRTKSGYFRRTMWRCKQCGYEEHNDTPTSPPNHNSSNGIPPILFPFGGGSSRGFGGGGFGGGSFGGGSFGGGGSGGRF
ncbi:MAG: TPM domain-containing protein [Bacteroidaceae bacterium]|nr:TPM domain-containing protein [Bacteroidaceae bacterium]